MSDDANRDAFADGAGGQHDESATSGEESPQDTGHDYGAEHAPDDTAPDIVVRGAEKDEADAEERRRRET